MPQPKGSMHGRSTCHSAHGPCSMWTPNRSVPEQMSLLQMRRLKPRTAQPLTQGDGQGEPGAGRAESHVVGFHSYSLSCPYWSPLQRGPEEGTGLGAGHQLSELLLAFLTLYIQRSIFLTLFPYLIWFPFQLSSLCAAASLLPGLIALI